MLVAFGVIEPLGTREQANLEVNRCTKKGVRCGWGNGRSWLLWHLIWEFLYAYLVKFGWFLTSDPFMYCTSPKASGWIPKIMAWKRWTPLKYGHSWYLCKISEVYIVETCHWLVEMTSMFVIFPHILEEIPESLYEIHMKFYIYMHWQWKSCSSTLKRSLASGLGWKDEWSGRMERSITTLELWCLYIIVHPKIMYQLKQDI